MTNHPNRKRSSGNAITLVRRRSGFVNIDDSFEVLEPGRRIDEYNEQTEDYRLPDGYRVAQSNMQTLEIYEANGTHCAIVLHRPTGRPQLVSGAREMPVLKRKQDVAA